MTKRPSRTLPLIALLGAILPLVVAVPSSAGVGAKGMSVQAIRVTAQRQQRRRIQHK